ncbi:MAG TPA: hypothetical protein VFV90_07025, partial [Usitatibacter sp.]|nr:hypothetical protein [Usitatibacter sp.]
RRAAPALLARAGAVMPGICLPEPVADEMDLAKWDAIRRDEALPCDACRTVPECVGDGACQRAALERRVEAARKVA